MANVQIQIKIRGGVPGGQWMTFKPRQAVEGSVEIVADNNLNCRHFWVRLEWHTEGRGNRDRTVVAEMDVFQGSLGAGIPTYHDFQFMLPDAPWSFAGHYVNIIWEITTSIDIPRAADPNAKQRFILAPPD